MSDVVIYGTPFSTFVRTARMALEEKGVTYQLDPLAPHSPEIKNRHPLGKVPAFRHGEVNLVETIAIVTYVDEAFDGPPLRPTDPAGRARVYQWVSLFDEAVHPTLGRIGLQRILIPARGGEADQTVIAEALPKARRGLEIFDAALAETEWVAGKTFTIADMFLAPMTAFVPMLPEADALLGGLENLSRWTAAVQARSSFLNTAPPPLEDLAKVV